MSGTVGTWTLTDNGSGGNDATSVNMGENNRIEVYIPLTE